jgi:hypothetical protein
MFIGRTEYQVIGVAPKGFTGTEPGSMTAVFTPAMMNREAINNPNWTWLRIWVRPRPGVTPSQVQQMLQARHSAVQADDVKNLAATVSKERLDAFLNEEVRLQPAGSGVSDLKDTFKRPLLILIGLAAMILLMASVNVASTLLGQSLDRQPEMALRISIGATRARLVRLVMVESACWRSCLPRLPSCSRHGWRQSWSRCSRPVTGRCDWPSTSTGARCRLARSSRWS